ncbi:MAG: hypothetical protein M3466_03720 [Gemmatimonadota bacterium]|nr:hypothetical protein [Gemmatimonadota bacterium]
MPDLFDPIDLGGITAASRIFMAPMTRSRADRLGRQPDFAADYYAQRANAGVIHHRRHADQLRGAGIRPHPRTPHAGAGRVVAPSDG